MYWDTVGNVRRKIFTDAKDCGQLTIICQDGRKYWTILLNNTSAKMIILEIIGGLLVLFLAAQILGATCTFRVDTYFIIRYSRIGCWYQQPFTLGRNWNRNSGSHRIWYIECYCWRQLTSYYKDMEKRTFRYEKLKDAHVLYI